MYQAAVLELGYWMTWANTESIKEIHNRRKLNGLGQAKENSPEDK